MSDQTTHDDYTFFFAIVGFIGLAFGACVALFNFMHEPVLSALASILFMFVGGACSMYAVGSFFHRLDKTHFMGSNASMDNHH